MRLTGDCLNCSEQAWSSEPVFEDVKLRTASVRYGLWLSQKKLYLAAEDNVSKQATAKSTKVAGNKGGKAPDKAERAGKRHSSRKVWHITDFQDLFELSDDVRKGRSGPLRYTKSIVTLSPFAPDGEARHFERMCLLKSRPERHLLRSTFEDLKNWTSAKQFGPRGFLVTSDGKPAGHEYLAAQLGLSAADIKQALPILEALGFLERIPLNGQLEPTASKRKKRSAKKRKKTASKGTQKKARESQNATKGTGESSTEALPDSAVSIRNGPERSGNSLRKAKSKSKAKGKEKQKAPDGLTAKGNKEKEKRLAVEQGQSQEAAPSVGQAEPQAEPFKPHLSDASGGDARVIPIHPPGGSVKSHTERSGGHIHHAGTDYNRFDVQYGTKVFRTLGYQYAIDSIEAIREITAFASAWHKALERMSGAPPPEIDKLGARLITEARKIARRRNKNRNPGAVWCTVLDRIVNARTATDT